MKASVKAAFITGILGVVGTVSAAIIGNSTGEKNAIQQLYSQITTVNGNNNTITINSVDEFIVQYNKVLNENETLKAQNSQYFSDYTEQKNINKNLESQLSERPDISYNSLGLSINTDDIPINKNNSMITIDGREYLSKEIVEKLIPDNQNMTIKDDTLFIGKVVADKANLFDQHVNNSILAKHMDTANDAFGNTHSKVLYFNGNPDQKIIYALNGKYSLLDFKVVPSDQGNIDNHGKIIIEADGIFVYTSGDLTKETSPFEEKEIPINNCMLLTVKFDSEYFNDYLIYDAIVYN